MTTVETRTAPRGAGAVAAGTPPGTLRRSLSRSWAPLAGVVGATLIWELASRTGLLPSPDVPPPSEVLGAMIPLLFSWTLWTGVAGTLKVWGLAMLISMLTIPIGILFGINPVTYRASRFIVEFARAVPPVVILPLAVLQFGVTLEMELALVVFMGAWTILFNSMYGARDVDPVVMDTARVFGVAPWRRFVSIILPTTIPFVMTGIRIAAAGALLLTVLAELIAGAPGIGLAITKAQHAGAYPEMYALITFTGLLGLAINAFISLLERPLLRWNPRRKK